MSEKAKRFFAPTLFVELDPDSFEDTFEVILATDADRLEREVEGLRAAIETNRELRLADTVVFDRKMRALESRAESADRLLAELVSVDDTALSLGNRLPVPIEAIAGRYRAHLARKETT